MALYLMGSLAYVALPRWFPSAELNARLIVSAAATLLFFVSILGHELGHAFLARRHGVGVDGITLWLLGGIARLRSQAPTPAAEFQIAIAGPAVSLLLVFAFAGSSLLFDRYSAWPLAAAAFGWLALVNLLLAVSNLVPAAPLDGGRVLTAILWKRNGDPDRSRVLSARAGLILGAALFFGFIAGFFLSSRIAIWWAVLGAGTGIFLAHAAVGEIRNAVVRGRLRAALAGSVMAKHPPPVPDSLTAQQFLDWTGSNGGQVACPVVRWDQEPIGYIAPAPLRALSDSQRSWTTVTELMTPAPMVDRAWVNESVQEVLQRLEVGRQELVVLHDPTNGSPVGTITRSQIEHLFVPPTVWGTERKAPPTAEVEGHPADLRGPRALKPLG